MLGIKKKKKLECGLSEKVISQQRPEDVREQAMWAIAEECSWQKDQPVPRGGSVPGMSQGCQRGCNRGSEEE